MAPFCVFSGLVAVCAGVSDGLFWCWMMAYDRWLAGVQPGDGCHDHGNRRLAMTIMVYMIGCDASICTISHFCNICNNVSLN